METFGIIYRIWSKTTGMSYIGQTTRGLEIRVKEHMTCDFDDKFHNDIKRLGKDDFEYEIIEICLSKELNVREKYWINQYDSFRNGYNLDSGGGCCRDEYIVAKRNKSISDAYQNKTDEEKIELHKNTAKALQNLPSEEKDRLSKIRSENMKQRYASMSEDERKEWHSKTGEKRFYLIINTLTGEQISVIGREKACEILGITKSVLSHLINGRHSPIKGYEVFQGLLKDIS